MRESDVRTLDHAEFAELSSDLIEDIGGMRFRAHGNSMRPTIHSGDILIVEKTDPNTLRLGDIVLIQNATTSLLAHRIIMQDDSSWTTCGDALQVHDEPFTAAQLIGIIRTIEHDGKERRLSKVRGRIMAAISRHSTTLISRALKRLMR